MLGLVSGAFGHLTPEEEQEFASPCKNPLLLLGFWCPMKMVVKKGCRYVLERF